MAAKASRAHRRRKRGLPGRRVLDGLDHVGHARVVCRPRSGRATLREDLDDNATLHGKKLENADIVTEGVRASKASAKLLALLNRYSAKERKN